MVNGLLDFGDDDGLQGFVGGGAGVARVSVEPVFAGPFLDDSDTGFAWQAIAGVRAPLSDSIDVGLKYRFFNADNLDLVDQTGRDVSTRFRSHSLLGTLTFNFGGAEPPPPPAPPPPPRSEEHTSELQSLMRISYAVFCLKKQKTNQNSVHRHST